MSRGEASQAPLPGVGEGAGGRVADQGNPYVSCYTVPSMNLPSWMLPIPGTGEKYEDCKSGVARRLVCERSPSEHPVIQVGLRSCGRPECPECWSTWAMRQSDRCGSRITGFRDATRHRYHPRHVIVSLDDDESGSLLDEYEGNPGILYRKIKGALRKQAQAVGVKGGAMVIHYYRVDHLDFPEYDQDSKYKIWEQVRRTGRWYDIVRFSPHAHIIAYGYLNKVGGDKFAYKNKGPLQTREDVERVAYYMLSHCTLPPKGHALTYFGCCSYSKLTVASKRAWTMPLMCPVCGAHMVYEGTNEIHLVKSDVSTYFYKGPPI